MNETCVDDHGKGTCCDDNYRPQQAHRRRVYNRILESAVSSTSFCVNVWAILGLFPRRHLIEFFDEWKLVRESCIVERLLKGATRRGSNFSRKLRSVSHVMPR